MAYVLRLGHISAEEEGPTSFATSWVEGQSVQGTPSAARTSNVCTRGSSSGWWGRAHGATPLAPVRLEIQSARALWPSTTVTRKAARGESPSPHRAPACASWGGRGCRTRCRLGDNGWRRSPIEARPPSLQRPGLQSERDGCRAGCGQSWHGPLRPDSTLRRGPTSEVRGGRERQSGRARARTLSHLPQGKPSGGRSRFFLDARHKTPRGVAKGSRGYRRHSRGMASCAASRSKS